MDSKKTLVLLHGHGVDASVWDRVYAGLAADGPVLRPDLSQLSTYTTIDEYADDVYDQLRGQGIENAVLIGHSMGGYVALAFAERHPMMVRGLGLFHSTAYGDDESKKEQRTKAIRALTEEGAPKFIAELMPKMVSPDYPEEQVQALTERFSKLPVNALIAGVRAIAGRPDRTHVLRTAQFPILLLLGSKDQVIPYEQASRLADLNEHITVSTLPASGHLGMVEEPDETLKILKSFVVSS